MVSIGLLTYDELDISLLDELKGSNAEAAPKVGQVVRSDLFRGKVCDSRYANVFAKESAHKVRERAFVKFLFVNNFVLVSLERA